MQLSDYIKTRTTYKLFAVQHGLAYQRLAALCRGDFSPTLEEVQKYYDLTNGLVTIEDWLQLARSRKETQTEK